MALMYTVTISVNVNIEVLHHKTMPLFFRHTIWSQNMTSGFIQYFKGSKLTFVFSVSC